MTTPRIANPFALAPASIKAMTALEQSFAASGLDPVLMGLVRLRVSQINGCAFCIHMHASELRKQGVDEMRLHLLPAWRESSLYSARERAALGWAEALTHLPENGASDADYAVFQAEFTDAEQVRLTLLIGSINMLEAWDRMEADGTFDNLGLGAIQALKETPALKPAISALSDGAWARAVQQPNDAGAALTAILKTIEGPTPSRAICLAAVMMLEPHLITPLLPEAQARDWQRLVGQEAEPRTGNVVGFAARTNQGWGVAVSNHRGNGRLIEDMSAGTWAPGLGLDAFDTAGWADGRAGFVLEALRSLDLDATVTSMPDDIRGWIAHAAAA